MPGRRRALCALAFGFAILLVPAVPAGAACPERPACRGCGCKGGPGYRAPDGRCVGFRSLDRICGVPPETHCVFGNATGTGANRDCALAERPRKRRAGSEREAAAEAGAAASEGGGGEVVPAATER